MDTTWAQCEQVGHLLSMMVELKEEVERLRSIWGCESHDQVESL